MMNNNELSESNSKAEQGDKLRVLFVDDDEVNIESFLVYFKDEYDILTATSGEEGLEIFEKEDDIAMVISDQRMPGISGVDLLTHIYGVSPDTVRIIITGYMDVSDIIDSINKGHIYQYILKPWDIVQLQLILEQAGQSWRLTRENRQLSEELIEKNKLLQKVNKELRASEERLRLLTSSLITAQEEERKRISMELHDELNQSLAAVKLEIKSIENQLELDREDKAQLQGRLESLRGELNLIIENVRRLSRDLSPVIIDDLGLDAAIANLISSFTRYHKVECDAHIEDVSHLFETNEQRLIYRLMQETLNNIAKHARATALKVDVLVGKDAVSIRLEDNGKGFNYQDVIRTPANHRGIGLSAMLERVNMVGGEMEIFSEPDQGTSVLFSIPLKHCTDNGSGQ